MKNCRNVGIDQYSKVYSKASFTEHSFERLVLLDFGQFGGLLRVGPTLKSEGVKILLWFLIEVSLICGPLFGANTLSSFESFVDD